MAAWICRPARREFNLEIPVLEQAMPVRVMWSNGRNHGVMFRRFFVSQQAMMPSRCCKSFRPWMTGSNVRPLRKDLCSRSRNKPQDLRRSDRSSGGSSADEWIPLHQVGRLLP